MGMACDADARGTVGGVNPVEAGADAGGGGGGLFVVPSGVASATKLPAIDAFRAPAARARASAGSATTGMNAEETALILASLSKSKFGSVAFSSGESDADDAKHSDMEDLSGDDEDEDEDGEHGAGGSRVQRVQQINFDGPVGSKLDFMDDAGFSHRFRNESNRVKSLVTKHISIDELRAHFDRPIIDVAKDFGICITLMKKICRRNGIKRWPHRQIRSLSKSIASMEAAMLSAHGGEREKYRDQILNLKMKRETVIADPNKENAMRPKTPTKDGGVAAPPRALHLLHHHHHQGPKLSPRTNQAVQQGAGSANGQFVAQREFMAPVAIKTEAGSLSSQASGSGSSSSHSKGGRWTSEEHAAFLEGIRLYGKDWRRVAQVVVTRSAVQTRTHAQKYLLKFAGRFPFDADGVLKDKQHADDHVEYHNHHHHQPGAATSATSSPAEVDMEMASPDSGSGNGAYPAAPASSHSMMTPVARAVEAMAMILNSPDSVSSSPPNQVPSQVPSQSPSQSQTVFIRDDASMYSPMGSSSSIGRALPSLAMPAIKSEDAALKSASPPSPTVGEMAP